MLEHVLASSRVHERFTPHFALLGYLLPGLGHFVRGERWRGVAIFAGVMWLFLCGLVVGGIDVFDHIDNKWWFLGQAGAGLPAFAADLAKQRLKVVDPVTGQRRLPTPREARLRTGDPAAKPPASESLAHAEEIGSLFGALAGMLNILCVVDAAWISRRRRSEGP